MTNTELLKLKIKESGLKLAFICEALNVTRSCLYAKINGTSEFKCSEVNILCDVLQISQIDKEKIFFAS